MARMLLSTVRLSCMLVTLATSSTDFTLKSPYIVVLLYTVRLLASIWLLNTACPATTTVPCNVTLLLNVDGPMNVDAPLTAIPLQRVHCPFITAFL